MASPLLIDCDPGVDDMIALLFACASHEIRLLGVTTVSGNVGVDKTTANALAILALAGRSDVPVARGSSRPLIRSVRGGAADVHGDNGLGGVCLPPSDVAPDPRHAVDFLAETVTDSAEPVTLIATGPLTNIALFYARYPDVASSLRRVIIMGGSIGPGNVTPAAEFNCWFDPEAAYRVLTDTGLSRQVPNFMIGLDVAARVSLGVNELSVLRNSGRVGAYVADALGGQYLNHFRDLDGRDTMPIYDSVTVVEAVCPGLITMAPASVEVDTSTERGRGATEVHFRSSNDQIVEQSVGVDANGEKIVEVILERLAGGDLPSCA
ncbi:nucleoside hydrolase [Amycolatopsis sp. NPDC048633]|uniref:nucleoside hydrolase n=1 Tax=Amycolatopsis sp. NPDC048633 TaxID=3157095 RepID=UPI0033C14350